MRRWMWIGVPLLVVLGGIALGVGAYNAGFDHGLAETGRAVEVVRVGHPGFFFPFGLFLFPLFFIGLFLLIRGAFWRHGPGGPGHWGHGQWGPGAGSRGAPPAFEEWHRRQHEQGSGDHPGAGGEPASV